jgi:hypothetical protein
MAIISQRQWKAQLLNSMLHLYEDNFKNKHNAPE